MRISKSVFGAVVATGINAILANNALSQSSSVTPSANDTKGSSGKCVHNCSGYATCKGNGNDSCKGKNGCANQGLVPKECSSMKTEDKCKNVLSKKKETMCTWYTS